MAILIFLLPFFLLFIQIPIVISHGLPSFPNPRGTLNAKSPFVTNLVDRNAPTDYWAHFPSGEKDSRPGAGHDSQKAASGPEGWTPYKPMDRNFRWRAGVCGDPRDGKQLHLKGGDYYHNGMIVETYPQGGQIEITLSIVVHHNGYMELYLCDVDKCGGDISEKCFQDGHCWQLERAPGVCDTEPRSDCGPIDRNYPGRWYMPCSTIRNNEGWDTYGADSTIRYQLPKDVNCDHCVLQWFWTGANTCNPPGVREYYDGPDRPRGFPNCPGQGGAIGGVTKVQRSCSAFNSPEEYYQCIDIRIKEDDMPMPKPPQETPQPVAESGEDGSGEDTEDLIADIYLIADGGVSIRLNDGDVVDVDDYDNIAIEVVTRKMVNMVDFYINDTMVWRDFNPRYFLFGNSGDRPRGWEDPVLNEEFELKVRAGVDERALKITLKR